MNGLPYNIKAPSQPVPTGSLWTLLKYIPFLSLIVTTELSKIFTCQHILHFHDLIPDTIFFVSLLPVFQTCGPAIYRFAALHWTPRQFQRSPPSLSFPNKSNVRICINWYFVLISIIASENIFSLSLSLYHISLSFPNLPYSLVSHHSQPLTSSMPHSVVLLFQCDPVHRVVTFHFSVNLILIVTITATSLPRQDIFLLWNIHFIVFCDTFPAATR